MRGGGASWLPGWLTACLPSSVCPCVCLAARHLSFSTCHRHWSSPCVQECCCRPGYCCGCCCCGAAPRGAAAGRPGRAGRQRCSDCSSAWGGGAARTAPGRPAGAGGGAVAAAARPPCCGGSCRQGRRRRRRIPCALVHLVRRRRPAIMTAVWRTACLDSCLPQPRTLHCGLCAHTCSTTRGKHKTHTLEGTMGGAGKRRHAAAHGAAAAWMV